MCWVENGYFCLLLITVNCVHSHFNIAITVYHIITFFNVFARPFIMCWAVPQLRRSVTSLSPWRPRFNPRPFHVTFVVERVARINWQSLNNTLKTTWSSVVFPKAFFTPFVLMSFVACYLYVEFIHLAILISQLCAYVAQNIKRLLDIISLRKFFFALWHAFKWLYLQHLVTAYALSLHTTVCITWGCFFSFHLG